MIQYQICIFLIVGFTTVALDFSAYRMLYSLTGLGVDLCKALGFITGTVFSYFANRFWTFGHVSSEQGSPVRFVLLYASTLGANVLINALMLEVLSGGVLNVELSFIIATCVSATLNFLGMKFFVFRAEALSEKK